MTNREKYITKRDEYDTMIAILKRIRGYDNPLIKPEIERTNFFRMFYKSYDDANKDLSKKVLCPIDLVSNSRPKICKRKHLSWIESMVDVGCWEDFIDCPSCIQKWLNEESEG